MDPYERLTAINEALGQHLHENEPSKPKRLFKKFGPVKFARGKPKNETPVQMFSRLAAGIEKRTPDEVAAKLDAETRQQDKKIFGESRFDPSKSPTEKMDKEFDAAQQALTDVGVSHTGLPAVGSLGREKNIIKVKKQEDMRKAREVMQDFPNTQIKRA